MYTEKKWGQDDANPEPSGVNFKSKLTAFSKSVEKLKKVFRKGSMKKIGNTTVHVLNVERVGTATEALIHISDKNGKGVVSLKYWGPNKTSTQSMRILTAR